MKRKEVITTVKKMVVCLAIPLTMSLACGSTTAFAQTTHKSEVVNLAQTTKKNSKKKYYRRERHSYTKCERQFYVGDVSDSDIKAEFRNGVLRLSVPKSEEKKEQKKLINID